MDTPQLHGMIPPMVVPFDTSGEIDEAAFRAEARFLLNKKIDGISVGGSTGEGALLSDEEQRRCLEILKQENTAGLPVVAGIIRNSTRDAVRAARDAQLLGVDMLLVTPVMYHGATVEGNRRFFAAISEAVDLPIVIYNVVATNIISPEEFLSLLAIEQVVGIKQVDPVRLAEIVSLVPEGTLVYSAADQLLYSTYVAGAVGSISALVTVAPDLCIAQWEAFQADDQRRAMEIHRQLVPLVRSYLQPPYPGKVKALISLQGRSAGVGRMPNTGPNETELAAMRQALAGAGLLVSER